MANGKQADTVSKESERKFSSPTASQLVMGEGTPRTPSDTSSSFTGSSPGSLVDDLESLCVNNDTDHNSNKNSKACLSDNTGTYSNE